jgi:hypothetical protein
MEDIFAQASLCYLTNRCEEGFQFIYRTLINSSDKFSLNEEERRVFCFTSISILEKRSQSWINLHRLLAKTDHFNERQSIESYLQIILDEMINYAEQILHLINHSLSISSETQVFYWKLQGDIYFLLSQTSVFDRKLQHFLSSLHFYNQSLESSSHNATQVLSIIYNKALVC